jgi:hypothetical protein
MNGIDRRAALRAAMLDRWNAALDLIKAGDRTRLLPMPLSDRDRAHMVDALERYRQTTGVVARLQVAQ